MKDILAKKTLVVGTMLLFAGAAIVPNTRGDISSSDNVIINVQTIEDTTYISYHINDFTTKPVIIDGIEYSYVYLEDESNMLLKGMPDLPNICRSIIIPDNLKMAVIVTSSYYQQYENIYVAPSKGNFDRTINPDDVPYVFDEIYNKDTWFPQNIAELDEPYIIRDFRGQVVKINPFQYNPAKKQMRFYKDIEVKIYPTGTDTTNCIYRDELPSTVEIDFNQIYKYHFLNYGAMGRYTPVEEQGNMLVITYDYFWDTMVPFVQWKNMKGVATEMVEVSTIGDADAIKTYIENYYNDYGLTFVLLVGDVAQVPTLTAGSSASDPSYSYIVGNDHYPDLFVGRFSAQNTGDLETQVERSIEYERYPQPGADWYHKGTGVASSQGPGDDGEMDYEHIRNIRSKLMNYTFTEVDELYDGSQGGEDEPGNPTPSMVAEALNDGRSVVNYCGHGSPTGWGTSGFSNSDINNLVNDNMLPYVICVACNNGQFDDYDACFCEAWLRATNDDEPTGAIVSTGSSKSMSWSPPMDAQDEMNDLLVESYTDNVKHTIGGIHANGCMHMNDEYGSQGYSETDTWHVFGDPSLQIRTDTPTEMTVDHDEFIQIGAETFEVDVLGVENALCAISYEYELLGYGYTDETGHAVITFEKPMEFLEDGVDLVVTAYNKIPYNTSIKVGSSYPPEPPTIDGPTLGRINKEYEYSAVTTDPEGDQILYKFDWGDGTTGDWLGPVNSGESVTASHVWTEIGDYEVKARAKDVNESMSKWSDVYPVHMDVPHLDIDMIRGGFFRVSAAIKNSGIVEAEDINWEISLEGGTIFLGRVTTGTFATLPVDGEEAVSSNFILGFGEIRVKVTASGTECSDVREQGGQVFLFYIKVNPGGGGL